MTCSPRTGRRGLCLTAGVPEHAVGHAPAIPGTGCGTLHWCPGGGPRSKRILSWDTSERRQTAVASGVGHGPVGHSRALISARREAPGLGRAFLVSRCSPRWRPRPHPSPASRQAACSRPGTGFTPGASATLSAQGHSAAARLARFYRSSFRLVTRGRSASIVSLASGDLNAILCEPGSIQACCRSAMTPGPTASPITTLDSGMHVARFSGQIVLYAARRHWTPPFTHVSLSHARQSCGRAAPHRHLTCGLSKLPQCAARPPSVQHLVAAPPQT